MKRFPVLLLFTSALIAVLLVGLVAGISSNTSTADAATPRARPPRPTPLPTAQLGIHNADKVVTPAVMSSGIPMTYTLDIGVPGDTSMAAFDASFELPLVGDQKFVSFSSTNSNWKLRQPVDNTVFVDMGRVDPGVSGTITIHAIFPTNYEKAIFRQTVFLNWTDEHYSRHAGTNLTLPIAAPAPVTPTPIDTPVIPTNPPGIPSSGPFAPVADPGVPNSNAGWYFPATRHTLHNGFLGYWLSHGSVTVLGYPISEEFSDNGRTVQYFERGVMEYWPENPEPYKVLLRSLGREIGQMQDPVAANSLSPNPDSVYYAETGHWLDGRFVDTWKNLGGLMQFGFPISEPIVEGNKLIQWTERARFELDLSRPDQIVMLGLVGDELAQSRGFIGQ
ncbi:MAG TPA: hypothetical protein VH186_30465 [Chloroflexia bacterium]|nr:hypothetical protein [Chloroflexia bacterium]